MKKIFICVLFANIYFTCQPVLYAQEALNKGVYSLAGTINYSSSSFQDNYSSYNTQTFAFAPQFVYFVDNHAALGIVLSYINTFEGTTIQSFSIGPSFRYYFFVKEIIPFLEASVDIDVPNLGNSRLTSIFNACIKGGFDYFLSNSVALEASVSYTHSSSSQSDSPFMNILAMGVGVNYFIFKEK
jgi:hypothetical protein